jgi:translation initiation factor IF-3
LLQRLAGDVEELGFVEAQPKQDGRNMIMVIGPHRKKSESRAERSSREAEAEAEAAAARPVPRQRRPAAAPASQAHSTGPAAGDDGADQAGA